MICKLNNWTKIYFGLIYFWTYKNIGGVEVHKQCSLTK